MWECVVHYNSGASSRKLICWREPHQVFGFMKFETTRTDHELIRVALIREIHVTARPR